MNLRSVACLGVCLVVQACAQRPADTIELWAMGREGEMVQRLLPEFERRHPDIRVRVQQIPWSAAHEKLLTAVVGESTPDVAQLGNTWIPELAAIDALLPLDRMIAEDSGLDRGRFFAGILDAGVIDGSLYGIPWYVDTRLLFYRKDLLAAAGYDAPPKTWDEWRTAMLRTKQQMGVEGFPIVLPLTEWEAPVILALQHGAQLLGEDDTHASFRSPEFRRALEFYVGLFRDDIAPRSGGAQSANLYQDFGDGYFASFLSGPWSIGELRARLPGAVAGRWATAPLPALSADGPGPSLAGGASLAIFRGAKNPTAALKLVGFLSESAQQVRLYELTGDLPARIDAWQAPAVRASVPARAFFAQVQNVRSVPKIPEWERIANRIARATEAVIRGEIAIDEALARLDADVDRILEKRRWMIERKKAGAARRASGDRS